jgi:RNA polymerase sigma-70 factor (ECF subfamily)
MEIRSALPRDRLLVFSRLLPLDSLEPSRILVGSVKTPPPSRLCTGVVDDAQVEDVSEHVERVYRSEALKMWRALVGYSGDWQAADDAVAEAFARALRDHGSIDDLRAWTWRVAFRLAAAEIRNRERPGVIDVPLPTETSSDAADLVAALRELPERQRMAVVLHDYADRATTEVAAILGCSTATVHVHLSRGRKRLRELLEISHA